MPSSVTPRQLTRLSWPARTPARERRLLGKGTGGMEAGSRGQGAHTAPPGRFFLQLRTLIYSTAHLPLPNRLRQHFWGPARQRTLSSSSHPKAFCSQIPKIVVSSPGFPGLASWALPPRNGKVASLPRRRDGGYLKGWTSQSCYC